MFYENGFWYEKMNLVRKWIFVRKIEFGTKIDFRP